MLDSYSLERSSVGEKVLKAAGRLTAVAVLENHTAQTVRNFLGHVLFGLVAVRRALANEMTELSIGYEHSPLNGPRRTGFLDLHRASGLRRLLDRSQWDRGTVHALRSLPNLVVR